MHARYTDDYKDAQLCTRPCRPSTRRTTRSPGPWAAARRTWGPRRSPRARRAVRPVGRIRQAAAGRAPAGATSAPRCSCSSPRSRATATGSCRRSSTAARASGARAPARSTPPSSSSRTRGSSAPRSATAAACSRSPTTGRKHVEENDLGAPWEAVRDDLGRGHARASAASSAQVATAAWQVGQAGTERQIAEAQRILGDTRRALYRILAEDDEEHEGRRRAVDVAHMAGGSGRPPSFSLEVAKWSNLI